MTGILIRKAILPGVPAYSKSEYPGENTELLLQSEAALIILLYFVAEAAIIRLRNPAASLSGVQKHIHIKVKYKYLLQILTN